MFQHDIAIILKSNTLATHYFVNDKQEKTFL